MLLDDALDILKDRLEVIDGLTVTTNPSATIVVPMATVNFDEVNYRESMTPGGAILDAVIVVYVSTADSAEGMVEARGYLSPDGANSVRAALEVTTDDLTSRVTVLTGSAGPYERLNGERFIVARFTARVHLSTASY